MHALAVMSVIVLAGCTGEVVDWNLPAPDPFAELERLQREGPPRYASRVHSCPKTRYRTLGNLMASRGVDGVTCLIGVPATPAHLEICNQTVSDAADVEAGKRLAVAVLAAAAHT